MWALLRFQAPLVLSLCAPPASRAEPSVSVYGLLDTTLRHATHADAGGSSLFSMNDGAFTGSRLGFRGTEDLSSGMKAFFSIEQGLDPSAGTLMQVTAAANYGQTAAPAGRAFGREALVGLNAGSAGTLTIGRQYTLANVYSGRFQPNANPNQEVLALLVGHQLIRQDNMVQYTVDAGPVSASVSATLGEGMNGASWAFAVAYKADGVDAAAYSSSMHNVDNSETRRVLGTGAAFKLASGWKAYLGTMKRRDSLSRQTNTVWVGALAYSAGSFVYTLSAGEDRQRRVAAGSRQLAWLHVDYLLSKRTDLYVVLDANRITGAYPLTAFMTHRGQQHGAALGVRHRF
ncbi:porin [Pelomonas sp. P8]|uniref:Porin n=2 Tax=Pelomonas cellulosilytica TaxID=2906762 RepID=A0ABS8XZ47_9BURK|nr:porin [Pelomonas sp. P8]MCE4556555.1 porin [Pelomonas sp. P8]